MNDYLNPPQPIPYPENRVLKQLYRFPILLYRLGLGNLIGKMILILSTCGRKTGKVRRAAVEYFQHEGQIYVISGFGHKPDWVQNLKADPHVSINTNQGVMHAIARKPNTEKEWQGVIAYLRHSPISNLSNPDKLAKLNDPEILAHIKTWPVWTFDKTIEPVPDAVEPDLVWTWPLIFLLLAINILVGWFINRSH